MHNLVIIFNMFRDLKTLKTFGKFISNWERKGTRLKKSVQMFCFECLSVLLGFNWFRRKDPLGPFRAAY